VAGLLAARPPANEGANLSRDPSQTHRAGRKLQLPLMKLYSPFRRALKLAAAARSPSSATVCSINQQPSLRAPLDTPARRRRSPRAGAVRARGGSRVGVELAAVGRKQCSGDSSARGAQISIVCHVGGGGSGGGQTSRGQLGGPTSCRKGSARTYTQSLHESLMNYCGPTKRRHGAYLGPRIARRPPPAA